MIDEKYIKEGHVGNFLLKLSVIEPSVRKKIIKNLTTKLINGEEKYKFLLIDLVKTGHYISSDVFRYRIRYSFICRICKNKKEENLTLVLLENYYSDFPTICDKCK